MLEEVFRVAPVPEDYMKYQLHLSTGMDVPQIEQWFQNRRSNEGSSQRPLEGGSLFALQSSQLLWLHRRQHGLGIEEQSCHTV